MKQLSRLGWRRQCMAMSFVMRLDFWRKKCYRIWLDSFVHLSWFTQLINTTVCWTILFSMHLKRHHYELDPVNTLFFDCFVLKYLQYYLQWNSSQWYLVLFFSTSQWFATIEQFFTIDVCFPKIKTKSTKPASLVLSASKLQNH